MKTRRTAWILCIFTLLSLLTLPVSADMGPKPSVRITFEGLGDAECWGTLLSEDDSTGPSSAWDGSMEAARENAIHSDNPYYENVSWGYEIWEAFALYEDTDGYYFLQELWQVNETKELAWTYYPPSPFKILLYFPEYDTYAVSGICEDYAFDSYFTVDMGEQEIWYDGMTLTAVESYDYTWETVSLICRIVLTVLLEIGIALLFRCFRYKKPLLAIVCVNLVTQIGLNTALNVINYHEGSMAFTFWYILLETAVFLVEGTLYTVWLNRMYEEKIPAWRYAFAANLLSFAAGLILAHVIPGIF